ncbi:MAG: class I SAM-dependent methyltransferase [Mycobacterium sp.]
MLSDFIQTGDSVLDVGCGTAVLTECLAEMFGAQVTGVDVIDIRVPRISFQLFDGVSIPFPDNSFDHVVLSYTLHHCHKPQSLIEECRRVARRSILVFEDLPTGPFGRLLVALHVEAFRIQFRLKERGGDYRSALEWLSGRTKTLTQTPVPYEWFDRLYVPRRLLAYSLP